MTKRQQNTIVWLVGLLLVASAAGCHKKVPVAAAPPPPPPAPVAEAPIPAAPTISEFMVEPGQIERGQSALLRWQVKDATQININQGIGGVAASGQQRISPENSTTYKLVATGPGGTANAEATLNVTAPPPPAPAAPAPAPTISERLSKEVQDAFFDFDKSDLRPDAQAVLTRDAEALKSIMGDFPNAKIVIEGHCDERGSAEYNLGLGDRRATSASNFLTQLGVPENRLIKISYGKERQQCTESNESCWQKNRRIHFSPGENLTTTSSVATSDEVSQGQPLAQIE